MSNLSKTTQAAPTPDTRPHPCYAYVGDGHPRDMGMSHPRYAYRADAHPREAEGRQPHPREYRRFPPHPRETGGRQPHPRENPKRGE